MADTLENVKIEKKTWVNLYAATGISVGTQITVQNLGGPGTGMLHLNEGVAAPIVDAHVALQPYEEATNGAAASGAWAWMPSGGKINVRVSV